jgi:uncharacterized protein with GYD domain
MATYILLSHFSDQGIRNVMDTTKRADAVRQMAQTVGATVTEIYWTLGRYDVVAIVEAPDTKAVTAFGLSLGRLGNVRTETLPAFTKAEMETILSNVVA